MKKVFQETSDIYLRLAEYVDLNDIFEWRNDIETRKASFNTKEIDIKEHTRWFKSSLLNPERNIFIICDINCNKLGQIRFDRKVDCAEISIIINPKYRNQGIGTLVLTKSSESYLNNFSVKKLVGKVKLNNTSSLKTFEKAGFKIHKKLDECIELNYEK